MIIDLGSDLSYEVTPERLLRLSSDMKVRISVHFNQMGSYENTKKFRVKSEFFC